MKICVVLLAVLCTVQLVTASPFPGLFGNIFKTITDTASNVVNTFTDTATTVIDTTTDLVSDTVDTMADAVDDVPIFGEVADTVASGVNQMETVIDNTADTMADTTNNIADSFQTAADNVIEGIDNTLSGNLSPSSGTTLMEDINNLLSDVMDNFCTGGTMPANINTMMDTISGFTGGLLSSFSLPNLSLDDIARVFNINDVSSVVTNFLAGGDTFLDPLLNVSSNLSELAANLTELAASNILFWPFLPILLKVQFKLLLIETAINITDQIIG